MNNKERISHELHYRFTVAGWTICGRYGCRTRCRLLPRNRAKSAAISYGKEDSLNVSKPVKGRKIATNIAEFYALECGTALLCAQTNTTVYDQLQENFSWSGKRFNAVLLLKRFANATWKAGQPFKGMARIKGEFISSNNCLLMKLKKTFAR